MITIEVRIFAKQDRRKIKLHRYLYVGGHVTAYLCIINFKKPMFTSCNALHWHNKQFAVNCCKQMGYIKKLLNYVMKSAVRRKHGRLMYIFFLSGSRGHWANGCPYH